MQSGLSKPIATACDPYVSHAGRWVGLEHRNGTLSSSAVANGIQASQLWQPAKRAVRNTLESIIAVFAKKVLGPWWLLFMSQSIDGASIRHMSGPGFQPR
jgi:hypothetical protein